MIEIITTQMEDAVVLTNGILAEEDAEDVEEAVVDAVEKEAIVTIWKMCNVSIVAERATILLTAYSQERMTMNRRISRTYSNRHWRKCWPKRTNKQRKTMKAMMTLRTWMYLKNSWKDKKTHKYCDDNNHKNKYDELAYPFSKIIKLKHEPEKAQENVPVQYTADIIVEIKNRDGTVVPMRLLLDTGTTDTIILRDFVG
jgi:hypothetical protein